MADPLAHAPARVVGLLVAVVVAVAAIGIATGMSNSSYQAKRPAVRERPPAGDVPPARSHTELQENPWTTPDAASAWQKSVAIAAAASAPISAPAETAGTSIEKTLIERAARRAYDGAPPVVPHPIRASGAAECLACHAKGFALGNRRASGDRRRGLCILATGEGTAASPTPHRCTRPVRGACRCQRPRRSSASRSG